MTDLKLKSDNEASQTPCAPAQKTSCAPSEAHDRNQFIPYAELLFFAYRDFVSDPDAILTDFGFGRAHHRVLHFVNHHPGLRVADLLKILKITKQSLARVLKQLVDEGFIRQETGVSDRRERRLYTTSKGQELVITLMKPQLQRIQNALRGMDKEEQKLVVRFLYRMMDDQNDALTSGHLYELIKETQVD